jgi:DNA-binding HxlR family transcriptional regulator
LTKDEVFATRGNSFSRSDVSAFCHAQIMTTQKSWWAPVWRGLVVDPEGKHCRKMKNAVWLFLHLILHADRRSGQLRRKCKTVAEEMGVPEKTIQRWLKTLKANGYIETKNTGRCLEIGIKLWKNTGRSSKVSLQHGQAWPARVDRREDSRGYRNWQKLLM